MGAGAPASQLPPVPFDRTARVPHSPEAEARIRLPLLSNSRRPWLKAWASANVPIKHFGVGHLKA
jgi:hypothetical protein